MDNFEVPSIPKIFVPQNIANKESENVSNSSKLSSKNINESNNRLESDTTSTIEKSPIPQLCPSCSQILLSYFMPLQQYVNQVVQMARGDRPLTTSPLQNLLNIEVLKTTISVNDSQSKDRSISGIHSENSYQKESNRYENVSERHQNSVPFYSNNDSNVNKNQNLNSNQSFEQNADKNFDQKPNETNVFSNTESKENRKTEESIETTNNAKDSHNSWNNDQKNVSFGSNERTDENVGKSDQKFFETNDQQRHEAKNESTEHKYSQQNTQSFTKPEQSRESEFRGNESPLPPSISSPYAFVTIAYNNLSATNAIILANSLLLTNNKSMNYMESNGNKNSIQIPFVILIGGNIDPVLKDAIYMIFDEVISQPMDVKLSLLSDQSFGIRQFKTQLWKELEKYDKCLYLESSTLVVGRVTNLFEECWELSACVDWLFPDNFNCSVFVFEPTLTTYEQMISFAVFHQKCSSQKDEGGGDALDEMTLLNQFFAPKWNRISFIYNFVKNDSIYTQIPAFMKYGESIKIVNFGHMMSQSGAIGNHPGTQSVQPWHILFDLLACGQQDVIKAMAIDNFSKFYLNCFIQRLWPILQTHLTPLLVSKYGIGRREWSIFDLIRLLTNESGIETDDHMFTQTPITFRRIKSPTEKMAKYDALSIDEDDYMSEQMTNLLVDESGDEEEDQITLNSEQTSELLTEDSDRQEMVGQREEAKPQQTPQQRADMSKREWEAGRIDWMGAHGSDKIINRLKKIIRND